MSTATEIWSKLQQKKAAVRAQIASGSTDDAKLRQLTEWIRQELDLESKYKALLSEAEHLILEQSECEAGSIVVKQEPVTDERWSFSTLNKHERVKVARLSYLRRQQELGSYSERAKGKTLYRRKSDGVVFGLTFSIDTDKKGKKWFLGLPENLFQEAVLLCQSGPRAVKVIHLPHEFCEKYARHFSVGANLTEDDNNNRQLKLPIFRDGQKWFIEVPQPVGPVEITKFVQPEELICSLPESELGKNHIMQP